MALSQKLVTLERLANNLGYNIIASRESAVILSEKVIKINTKQKPLKRAWVIAHEIGHIVTQARLVKEAGKSALDGKTYEWPALEAEFRAWRTADKLLRELKLYSPKYLQFKHQCMRSYYCSCPR